MKASVFCMSSSYLSPFLWGGLPKHSLVCLPKVNEFARPRLKRWQLQPQNKTLLNNERNQLMLLLVILSLPQVSAGRLRQWPGPRATHPHQQAGRTGTSAAHRRHLRHRRRADLLGLPLRVRPWLDRAPAGEVRPSPSSTSISSFISTHASTSSTLAWFTLDVDTMFFQFSFVVFSFSFTTITLLHFQWEARR